VGYAESDRLRAKVGLDELVVRKPVTRTYFVRPQETHSMKTQLVAGNWQPSFLRLPTAHGFGAPTCSVLQAWDDGHLRLRRPFGQSREPQQVARRTTYLFGGESSGEQYDPGAGAFTTNRAAVPEYDYGAVLGHMDTFEGRRLGTRAGLHKVSIRPELIL